MMSRHMGRPITLLEHIEQSIDDILTTPLGSRVMRRDYGSLLFHLVDQPINDALILQIYSAIYVALLRWEDRISVSQIQVNLLQIGQVMVDLDGELSANQQPFSLSIPLQMGAIT